MSYNVSAWRTEEMVDFRVNLDAIHANNDYLVKLNPDDEVKVTGWPESFEMKGHLVNGQVVVSELYYGGEGSGSAWEDFKLMLSQSIGKLVSSQVWEGGGSISKLIVDNGIVSEEEVEI